MVEVKVSDSATLNQLVDIQSEARVSSMENQYTSVKVR